MPDLMFIESPAKMKSIGRYLSGKNIDLFATYGHIREVKKNWMGSKEGMFKPQWENSQRVIALGNEKVPIIEAIRRKASQAKRIYLATDPDREGEAISWHIYSILGKEDQRKCLRAVFNEITEKAIKNSLDNTREIDQAIINSYLARVLLDRWIGYKLSDYTRKKVGGVSAGRVQSIALKFLVDREEEIKSFQKENWFVLKLEMENGLMLSLVELSSELLAQVKLFKGEKKGIVWFQSKNDVEKVVQSLDQHCELIDISQPRSESISSPEVLRTSTLYESAINKLGMRASVVEKTAQNLYEGINLGGETIALITYPRTDKTELSEDFVKELKSYILSRYSSEYWNSEQEKKDKVVKKDKLVQGAHEGIRPVDLNLSPEKLEKYIPTSSPEYKLYKLIWATTCASFCSYAKNEKKTYTFYNNKNLFNITETKEVFDGFKKILREYGLSQDKSDSTSSSLFEGLREAKKYAKKQEHIVEEFTTPPAKYSEASLIKALENKGIGRPSTYPVISKIIQSRNYAVFSNRKFEITELGYKVSKDLEKNFSNFISYDYTRSMEEELDNISQSKTDWKSFLNGVFIDWDKSFSKAEKFEVVEYKSCPDCSQQLVYKHSRWGKKFIGCSGFPNCRYTEIIEVESKQEEILETLCPECNSNLVKKKSKRGNYFNACPNFPKCRYIEKKEKVEPELVEGRTCPKCSGALVYKYSARRNSKFISCSNFPKCKHSEKFKEN